MTSLYGIQWDTVGRLPFVPSLQAFYLNGRFATSPASYGRGRVWIDVLGGHAAQAYWSDIETGDMVPADVPRQLDERRAAGLGAGGIYCNRSSLDDVILAADGRDFGLWLATLDGTTDPAVTLPANVTLMCVQAIPASMLGFQADLSVVVNQGYWQAKAA